MRWLTHRVGGLASSSNMASALANATSTEKLNPSLGSKERMWRATPVRSADAASSGGSRSDPVANAWAAAGDLFLADGALDESADAYRRALELDSSLKTPRSLASRLGQDATSEDPVLRAAAKAEKEGDYAASERLLRFLHSSKPKDSEAQIALARVLWRQNHLAEADQLLETVPESAKNWQVALLEAKVAVSSEKWEKAQGSLLLSRQLRPGLRATELLLTYVQEQIAEEKAANMPKDL